MTFARIFVLSGPHLGDLQLDCYEIFGNVQIIDDVPESGATTLIGLVMGLSRLFKRRT